MIDETAEPIAADIEDAESLIAAITPEFDADDAAAEPAADDAEPITLVDTGLTTASNTSAAAISAAARFMMSTMVFPKSRNDLMPLSITS